jgi:signal transduction histidine kinase
MKTLTDRLYLWLIPDSFHSDELNLRKARIYINATLITTLFAGFFLLNTLAFEMHYHLYSMVVCTFGFFLLAFFLKWGISLEVATHFFVGIAVTATVWNAWFLGGLQSYNLPWICFAPVLAILFGNPKIGWIWLGVSITAVLAMSAFQLTGYEFKTVINPRFIHFLGANSLIALVLILFFIVLITEQAYTNTLIKLNLKNKIIEKSFSELKSTQAQLVQSEKMASLGELTAGIAHEIQNPLNFVNNFSELNKELLDEMQSEIKNGNYAEAKLIAKSITENEEKILHHGKRADAIVKGMLQHSQTSSGQKEPTDINALADEYLRLSYHGLRAKDKTFNADFKTEFDPILPKINVISQDIGRVLLNLINNAFYAVNATVETTHALSLQTAQPPKPPTPYKPTVLVSTKNMTTHVEIRVKDNGPGIPAEIKDKIFQPFFTTKPTGQGTGLGLSLSYDIVKAHGGELRVETNQGEGSIFIITIPSG